MESRLSLLGVPIIDPRVRVIARAAVEAVPTEVAVRDNVIPISLCGGVLTVAVEDPFDFELRDKLRFLCRHPIEVVAADAESLRAVIRWHFGGETATNPAP